MRWEKPTAQGQTRVVKRLAWYPIRIEQETRWLESVYIIQTSFETQYYAYFKGKRQYTRSEFSWKNRKFTVEQVYKDYLNKLYETSRKENLF